MSNEEKFKLALFMIVRNFKVLPKGLKLGKSQKEINKMAVDTVDEVLDMIDYDIARKLFMEGIEE